MIHPQIQAIGTGYAPRPLQEYIHTNLARFNVLVCHRRFGKTVLAINELIDQGLRCKHKNPQYAYIAPTYGQAERIAWDMLKNYTKSIPGVEYNQTKLTCIIPRPAPYNDRIKIMLLGAENPDSMRGMYLDGAIFDEYGVMHPSVWGEVVRPALSDRKGWAIFIGTPAGQNHFYEIYKTALKYKGQGWFVAVFKASQTGVIPREELAAMRAEMSDEQAEQELECSFTAANTGSYFGKIISRIEKQGRVCAVPHESALLVSTYWDLGVDDTTTIWFAQRRGLEIRLIDYYEMSGEGLEHYTKVLSGTYPGSEHRRAYQYESLHNWPHDGSARDMQSGMKRSDTMRDLKQPVRVHQRYDVADSIEAVRNILPRCWFDENRCARGLESLKAYEREWDEKNMIFRQAPKHNWASHGADSFRLLAKAIRPEMSGNDKNLPRQALNEYDVFNPYGDRQRGIFDE
jgi:phage terminase large subunit